MPGKVKTLSQIADEYGVHVNTLKNWLKPLREKLHIKRKHVLLPWQIKMIYEFLDFPPKKQDGFLDF